MLGFNIRQLVREKLINEGSEFVEADRVSKEIEEYLEGEECTWLETSKGKQFEKN